MGAGGLERQILKHTRNCTCEPQGFGRVRWHHWMHWLAGHLGS